MRNAVSLTLGAAVLAMSSLAGAQDLNVSTTAAQPSTTTSSGGSVTDTSGATDHSVVTGHIGLRYFGSVVVPLLTGAGGGVPDFAGSQNFACTSPSSPSCGGAAGGMGMGMGMGMRPSATSTATLHTVGIRYWLNSSLGIEGGIAFGIGSGSVSNTDFVAGRGNSTTPTDQPNYFGIGLQAGLPIVLADSKHVSIHLAPYLGFHYASSAIQRSPTTMTTVDESASTFMLSLGANLAAELQFGFLGIPQLGLQAQFGLGMRYISQSVRAISNPGSQEFSTVTSGFGLATTVGPNYGLADIIGGSISAVWYFGGAPGR